MVLRRKFPTKLYPIPRQEAIHTECLRRSAEMHSLIAELGQMQRQQQEQLQRFSVNSAEETKEARQRFVELRDQLNRHSQRVELSIAEADRLCVEGADSLAPEQFHLLKESRQRLHSTFESLSRQTDSVLARLDLATALLLEFTARASAFQSWVYESGRKLDALRADSGHPNGLEESRRRFRTLNEEILAKRPELSGISQLAQRIETEIGAYLDEMSGRPAGREGTPTRGTQLQKHHQVRDTVQRAQDDYEALLNSKQDFDQMLRRLGNFSMQYEQRLGEANGWLDDLERAISHAAVGATGDIETRLANLLRLNQNAIEGQPKIDAAEAAAHQLDEATVQTDAHESLLAEHEEQIMELRRKYSTLSDRLKDGMDATRTEMTQREGLAQGLRQMDDWLGKMERKMGEPKRIQLNPTKLSELKYEDQLERGELESKERTLSELGAILRTQRAVKDLGCSGSEFEAQFGNATNRFRRIGSTARAHSDNLGDAIRAYEEWQREEASLADHLSSLNEAIAHLDPSDMEMAEKLGQELTELEASDWANLQELAKKLSQIPNVEGIDQITEKMRTHESLLARLRDALGSKLNSGHRLSQSRKQFWQKAQQIGNELGQIEQRIQTNANIISGTSDQREAQRNECGEMANNLGNIRQKLEELEQMGSDLIRNGGAKKLSGKDGVDPVTKITGQLFELHRREEDAQRALNELQGQIAEFDSATQTWLMDAETMSRWLDAENAKIGKGWATLNWEPRIMAEQRTEAQQGAQKQRKQQTKMTQLQLKYKELAGKGDETMSTNGINEIDNRMRELEKKWSGLEADWANMEKCIGTAESLHRDAQRMEHWLGAKVNLLDGCTISAADVKLVDAQLGIVNILETEMADERPRWNRLNDDAIEAVRLAQSETFPARIVARMDELNRKWRELEKSLEMKLAALNEARTQISNFEQLLRDFRHDLRNLESSLNEAAAMKPGQSQQLARLIEVQNGLENQLRPSLEEMRILAENIQRIWNGDSALRSDLDDRVDGMARQIEELKMKLESVKKAAESASAAEEELNQELAELNNWVQSQKRELDTLPSVSAEPNKLAEQIEQFQRPYADILAKEGCVIVAGSKAASLLSQTPSAELKRRLIHLNEIWPPLISAAKERHEKLGRTKKALDELIETEKEIKEKLATLNDELATVKLAEKDSATGTLPSTMESIHQRLISLGPCVESAFILMDKLERAVDGGSAETKKHRIALEQLRRDYTTILAECTAGLEQAKTKESLRARFDSEADSLQSLLDTYQSTLGIDDPQMDGARPLDMNGNAGTIGKDALKLGLAEFDSRWSKGLGQLQTTQKRLIPLLDGQEANLLTNRQEELEMGAKKLRQKLAKQLANFEEGEGKLDNLLTKVREICSDLSEFGEKIASLPGIGRDQLTLSEQQKECKKLKKELMAFSAGITELDGRLAEMAEDKHLPQNQLKSARMDLGRAEKQKEKLEGQIEERARQIEEMHNKLDELDGQVGQFLAAISAFSASEHLRKPIGTDLASLHVQKEELSGLKTGKMAELGSEKTKIEAECKSLIRGAGPAIRTEKLEGHLTNMNSAWESFSANMEHRERELDAAVQALGNIHEAQQSLLNWLEQTEELLADQPPPAADHKVVKAQLQSQQFQLRVISEKKQNVDGFLDLVEKLASQSEQQQPGQANQLRLAGEHISSRYTDLVEGVKGRHHQLEEALLLTQEWAQLNQALAHFLEETEKGILAFDRIPTDARRMDEQIGLQASLQAQTDAQRANFDRFVELSAEICQIVGFEDGQEVDGQMRQIVGRYDGLQQRLAQYNRLMGSLAEDIGIFLSSTAQMAEWLDRAEREVQIFGDLPIEPEELSNRSDALVEFVNNVSLQTPLLKNVIEISRELCTHSSGSDALALQYRTDQLNQRYNQLADDADAKIVVWEKALPLAENYKEGVTELREHLDGVEEDLQNLGQVLLEEQFQLVNTIDSDLGPAREQLEAIQAIGIELQRLTTEQRANQLAKESAELLRRFNAVADAVARKADQLGQAERQSRLTFDVLDFWIDWFNEVQEQIVRADKPAVDMEQLKIQLRQQRQLNEEIAAERTGLREMIADASKVARELSTTLGGQEGQDALLAKVERAKKMAEETAELGAERTAELEQAFALCKELDGEYTELNDWMDTVERELRACEPITTGMAPKALLAQQQHNNGMLQQIQSQRPIVAKFERNVAALSELCAQGDEQNLRQISEQIAERFEELANAFRERGDVLTASLEQSSQLGDRLNMFLANLGSALDQLRAQEPPSCRPPVLRRQMAEMAAIFELLRQKQPSYLATKEQCQEMIGQAGPAQQTLVAEMHQKMEELDHRWLELNSGAEFRQNQLATLLPIVEHFWAQLDRAQQAIGQCRQQCDQFGIGQSASDIDATGTQMDQLHQRHAQLQKLQAGIGECSVGVQQAIGEGMELCQRLGSEEEQTFVQQHLAALQAQWDAFLAHHSQLSGSLNVAMDQSLQFHGLLQQLATFLAQKESECANILFGTNEGNAQSPPPQKVEAISENLQIVDSIRRELDDAILRREQLNQMGAELCAQPGALNAATSIRQPLMELNQRWNRLYSQLGDQQHRLERSLLDMGQFAQAHGQMLSWMEKTEATLAGIYPNPGGGLKHVEIEMCKLRVLQNDIQAHQPSYEAILATGRQMLLQQPEAQQSTTQTMLEEMAQKWAKLCEKSEQLWANLERARVEAASRGNDLEKWQIWLADLLAELRSNRPIGGLPETAASQLDEFRVIRADVEQRRPEMEELLRKLGENDGTEKDELTMAQFEKLKGDWAIVQEKLVEREKRLRQALEDALELAKGMQEIQDWLQEAEQHLAMCPQISKLVGPLEEELAIHRQFNEEVQRKSQLMKELNNKGIRMQLSCEKKDAIPMKNRLVSLKHRTDKLQQKSQERLRILTNALEESKHFFGSRKELLDWIEEQQNWLQEKEAEKMGTGERIRELLDEHKRRLMEQIQRRGGHYEDTRLRGDALGEFAPPGEKRQIDDANEELHQKWTDLGKRALRRQRSLEEALIQSGQFEEVLAELLEWLGTKLPHLEAEVQSLNYFGDIDTVNTLMREHFAVVEQAEARKGNVQNVEERAKGILANEKAGDPEELKALAEKTAKMNDQWERLEKAIAEQDKRFTTALKKAVDLSEMMHDLGSGLQEIEGQIRRLALPWDEPGVLAEQEKLEKLRVDFHHRQPELEKVLELARELQSKAHPRAESPMRDLIRGIGNRWEVVEQLMREKGEKLRNRLEEIRQHERKMDELLGFVEEKQGQLDFMRDYKDEGQLARLNTFMEEERMFRTDLQQRQPELEEVLKMAGKRQSFGVGISAQLPSIKEGEEADELMDKSTISEKSPYKRRDSAQGQGQLSPTKRAGSKMKLNEKSASQMNLDLTKSPSAGGTPRVKRKSEQLGDGWKKLWADLIQYGEHLRERKAYLDEMERLKDFTFEEWRERYLAWNDHGKARVSDLFRRIDKTGTGMVPRKLFIDGILASKFPTTELEMGKVADEFDKGDGLISAREFMNALRYDPKKMRGRNEAAKTETERIHEEIARENARCTCAHRFPIHHISTEKDRVQYGFGFGGSMKRMVRILRSTVMVRVGGGWEALDGFLAKHDPCRAKGRINVDLLPLMPEGHLGPHGAHIDRIAEFHVRRKDSASSSVASGSSTHQQQQAVERLLGYSPGQPGPIMKLREKTERSMPMFKRPLAPGSNGSAASVAGTSAAIGGQHQRRGSDHSVIDDIYGSSRIPRAAGGSRLGSDLGSNPSRPASRGSDVGSDFGASTGSGTRIPSYRAQKGVRFAGIQSSGGSGLETPSAGSDQ